MSPSTLPQPTTVLMCCSTAPAQGKKSEPQKVVAKRQPVPLLENLLEELDKPGRWTDSGRACGINLALCHTLDSGDSDCRAAVHDLVTVGRDQASFIRGWGFLGF